MGYEHTLIKLKRSHLVKLFGVSKFTIDRWIRLKLLNPYSLEDIVDKYNNRYKLDKRRNAPHENTASPHEERSMGGEKP